LCPLQTAASLGLIGVTAGLVSLGTGKLVAEVFRPDFVEA
jgi:hypothetical protein